MNISKKQGAFRTALVALSTACMLFMAATPALAATATTTSAATTVTQTSARLNGSFDIGRTATGGADTWFQWGPSTAFGQTTQFVHSASASGSFTADLTGLSPNTKYFYRAMANNPTGEPSSGATMSFTTSSVKNATVATMSSTHTATTATLTGYYTAGTSSLVETQFLWGTNSSNLTNETGYVTRTGTSGNFTATVTNLSPNTQYYFKAVVRSTNNGTSSIVYGSALPFTTDSGSGTSSCVIQSFTPSPTSVTSGQSATLSWTTTNCPTLTLSGGVFSSSTQYGTWASTGALTTATTYTLRGTATDGTSTTAQTTVGITGGSGSSCVISSFYPSPSVVAYGNSTTLYWITSGCTTLAVTPNLGAVTTGSSSVSTNSIYTSTTYTLTGTDTSGASTSSTATVTISSNGNTACAINSFYGTPASVANGQSATLYWNTTGCGSVTITGGTLNSYSNLGPNGTLPTGALYGTTTYTITANGTNSASQSTTVSVTGSQYPYSYACFDGVDNDSDGLSDFPNDPGCYSQYDTDESNGGNTTGIGNVITLPASNIGTGSTRLNGAVVGTGTPVSTYFEYGQTVTLGQTTMAQTVVANGNVQYFDTITTAASRTYYYRAVVQINGMIIRGSIMSFTTASISANVPVYANTGFGTEMKTPTGSTRETNTASGITLVITNKSEKIFVGDTVDYTVVYANNTNKRLTDVTLSLTIPQGMSLVQTTQGRMTSPSTLEVTLNTIEPSTSGTIFVQAQASSAIQLGSTLVTNGTLSYTYPNGTRDSTVGFVLNHAGRSSFLGGFAFGTGFFPTTVLGWFMTILIILALILIIRRIVKGQDAGHGHGGHH